MPSPSTELVDILQEILSAFQHEDRLILATIISTTGSTPASAMAKMLIMEGGAMTVGTVGGGRMEAEVVEAAQRLFSSDRAEIQTFHLKEDELLQGLICGGDVDVLIEPVTKEHIPLFQEIKALRDEGEDCVVATYVEAQGEVKLKRLLKPETNLWKKGMMELWKEITQYSTTPPPHPDFLKDLHWTSHCHEICRIKTEQCELILEPFLGAPNLLIFGGGHVSRSICKAAAMAGFRVTVVDDREQYANPTRFPEAVRTIAFDFAGAFQKISIRPSTYVVIVTRDHSSDEKILERTLKTEAKYVGMIGSKRKVLATFARLAERGISTEELQRVHAPMGIEIGAVTPEEIGLSIAAELIASRRGEKAPFPHKSDSIKPLSVRSDSEITDLKKN